jgi:ligand-binding sensor domain-containing protein
MKFKYVHLILLIAFSISCNTQENKSSSSELKNNVEQDNALQIGQYVTGTFEDSKGHLWFGTIEKGIAHFDGKKLRYYTKEDGLPSNRVIGVIEDANGVFWLKTGEGLSKFDGNNFINFPVKKDDFFSNSISQLLIDSKGTFWVGTWGGVYTFNGKEFTYFPLPYPKVKTPINEDTKNWITEIKEDHDGNIWFARDGYGVCRFNGNSFTHFLKKDGLHSNNVVEIEIDNQGHLWIGTRVAEKDNPDPEKRTGKGGVNRITNKEIISFPEIDGFNTDDVYEIYSNSYGNIWISTVKYGVYRFDGKEFKNYDVPIPIMTMNDDQNGNLWLGGAGGLYKITPDEKIINVTTNGPWN